MQNKVDPKVQQRVFAAYVENKKFLIADTSATARVSIANALVSMGVKTQQITLVNSYAGAESEIASLQPQVVIADYDLGRRCGLDLLQKIRTANPSLKFGLFVLVTGNTSQCAVAKASEEDVDTYVIKPFTAGVLKASLLKAVMMKMSPPEYVKAIERGKLELSKGQTQEAIKTFEYSKTLDPSPSLGCFYLGQTHDITSAQDMAAADYSKGLEYNKIHYKCMVGFFENLMARKRYAEAYDVIKKISQYFPANPQRMTTVLRLAIMTRSYEDVERYYRIFTSIDERNEDMIKYVCAALVVCGKYYLQQNLGSRAIELFNKAAITARGRTRILREIVLALLDFGLVKEADEFLRRFPADSRKGIDYLAMNLAVMDQASPRSVTIDKGRELLAQNLHDPVIYRVLLKCSAKSGLSHAVEDLMKQAVTRYPNERSQFERALCQDAPSP